MEGGGGGMGDEHRMELCAPESQEVRMAGGVQKPPSKMESLPAVPSGGPLPQVLLGKEEAGKLEF